jgi:D-inositol-3-phosphate glycosyltransferase
VDLERFRPDSASAARTRLGIPPDAVVLLFVGRIQPLKGPDILLRAAAQLAAEQPRLRERLVVCVVGAPSGTGLLQPEGLRKLTSELGIGELVRFLSPMSAAELAGAYAAADLTVVPSYNESFGLVALESQACGTPVLAAAVGGLRTAVADGVSGLLVDGHDPAEYAAAIGRLVTRPADLELLATGCRSHAERFSWRRTAQRLISTYRDAMADPIFTPAPWPVAR